MKRFTIMMLVILPVLGFGQKNTDKKPDFTIPDPPDSVMKTMLHNIPSQDEKILYDSIIVVDSSLTKTQIFTRIRQWFAEKFSDSKSVLQVNDIENGLLTGKGAYYYALVNGITIHYGYLHFVLNVAVKDGKYRYQLYNFTSSDEAGFMGSTSSTITSTVNFNEVFYMYKQGDRPAYTRKYLSRMIRLVYYINTTLPEIVYKSSITDF